MKTDKTIEVSAVVTPNCAIANRNHMSSQRTLQNPETKKNQKNHPILFRPPGLGGSKTQSNTALYTLGNVGPLMPGALSIKYPFGVLPMKIVHSIAGQPALHYLAAHADAFPRSQPLPHSTGSRQKPLRLQFCWPDQQTPLAGLKAPTERSSPAHPLPRILAFPARLPPRAVSGPACRKSAQHLPPAHRRTSLRERRHVRLR